MTEKIVTAHRYIYKCQNKKCNHVYALEFDVTYYRQTRQYSYKMVNAPEWAVKRIAERPYLRTPREFTLCPECEHFAKMQIVEGHYSPEHECDGRCMSARGPNCDCSCGGANHGKNWVK